MSRGKKLLKNTMIISIGKISTQLITFFLLPLYTSILSTEEYGIVDLLNTLVSLMLPIITLQIEQATFRYLIEERDNFVEKKRIVSTSFWIIIVNLIFYLLLFGIISCFINNKYKYFLATNVVFSVISSFFLQIARGLGDNKKYSIGSFLVALSIIVFNIIFLVIVKLNVTGMLLANMLGQIVCIIYIFFSLKIYYYLSINAISKDIKKKLLKYSIPLIPNAVSWWIFNVSDRLIVSVVLGIGANGILAASHKFSAIYITLFNIFNLSWTEIVSLQINDVDFCDFFNKIFNIALKLFVAMAIGIIACMPFVYPIMVNINYIDGYMLIPILIIASLFNVFVGLISSVYVAKKNTKAVANTSIISATINILVHVLLIQTIGLYAAAISTLSAFVTMSVYRIYDIKKKYFSIVLEKDFFIKTLLVFFIVICMYYINNIYMNIISIMIAVVFAWKINKDSLSIFFEIIKKNFNKLKEQ